MVSDLPRRKPDPDALWMADAACKGMPTSWFYPGQGDNQHQQIELCAGCTVRQPCLEYAMKNNEQWGIWGGASERERDRIRQRKQRNATPDNVIQLVRALHSGGSSIRHITRVTGLAHRTIIGHLYGRNMERDTGAA